MKFKSMNVKHSGSQIQASLASCVLPDKNPSDTTFG